VKGTQLKNYVKPVLFSAATVAVMAGAAMSVITVPRQPATPVTGIDISVSAIASSRGASGPSKSFSVFSNITSVGVGADEVAIAATTTSCNVQPTNNAPYALADWYRPFESGAPGGADGTSKHPYIVTNIYRLNAEGRLEQLAASWVKHGWYAASQSQPMTGAVGSATGAEPCGTGVCPSGSPADNQLGSNCADTYTSGHNSDRQYLGPRSEVSSRGTAAAPGFAIRGSYLDSMNNGNSTVAPMFGDSLSLTPATQTDAVRTYGGTGTGQTSKLATIKKTDVTTAALGPSGRVYIEAYYVVNGDQNKLNNVAWRGFTSNYTTGGLTAANLNFASRHTFGPVMFQWGDQQQQATPTDDGAAYVSSRVVNNPDGTFRYEYNVYNLDVDRGIEGLSITLPTAANATEVNFRQPRIIDPGFDSQAWVGSVSPQGDAVTYSVPAVPPNAMNWSKPATPGTPVKTNAIRWGNMYTFWFTSDLPPRTSGQINMTLGGTGTVAGGLLAIGSVPRAVADMADGGDGTVDSNDFVAFINAFTAGDAAADVMAGNLPGSDGSVDGNDFIGFINSYIQG